MIKKNKNIKDHTMNKHILVDCDGVLLDTLDSIQPFLKSIGLTVSEYEKNNMYADEYSCFQDRSHAIKCFTAWQKNKSFSQITPLKGAVENLKKLRSLSFKISIITAAGHLDIAKQHRLQNLDNIFGKDFFENIIYVDWTESKNAALMKFSPTYFIEDVAINAINALQTHHQPILIRNNQNKAKIEAHINQLQNIIIIESWNEIFDIVTNNKK